MGSCVTLCVSVANLTVLSATGGEQAWLCLLLCNLDIILCALSLHWVTSVDRQRGDTVYESPYALGNRYAQTSRNRDGKDFGGVGQEKDTHAVSTKIVGGSTRPPMPGSDEEKALGMQGIHVRTVQIQELEYKRNGVAPLNVPEPASPSHTGSEDEIIPPASRQPSAH